MENNASDAALVPVPRDVVAVLMRAGAPAIITELVSLYSGLAEKMRKQELRYLDVPPVLASLALAPWYADALCWGRGLYQDGLYEYDEKTDLLLRVPDPYTRQEIREHIIGFLTLDDPRIAVLVPLSWRVGVVVGWLSGLSVSQREDVQAGMVMLAALVAPLLGNVPAGSVPNVSDRSRSAQSLPSGKSKALHRRSKSGRK